MLPNSSSNRQKLMPDGGVNALSGPTGDTVVGRMTPASPSGILLFYPQSEFFA
ncbi:hypothetical protein KCP75_12150 [Salmonella enterica subsp. enterica]|nr:hypothetical protein KCP75_12150 [Salmonella enterica subsp. enterica]